MLALDERVVAKLPQGLFHLLLCIHDKGPPAHERLVEGLRRKQEQARGLVAGAHIDVEDPPDESTLALPCVYAFGDVQSLEEVERDYILAVLRANNGDKATAAMQLQIGTATLCRKLKQHEAAGRSFQ